MIFAFYQKVRSNGKLALEQEFASPVLLNLVGISTDIAFDLDIFTESLPNAILTLRGLDPTSASADLLRLYAELRFEGHSQAFAISIINNILVSQRKGVKEVMLYSVFDPMWVKNLQITNDKTTFAFDIVDFEGTWHFFGVSASDDERQMILRRRIDRVETLPSFIRIREALAAKYRISEQKPYSEKIIRAFQLELSEKLLEEEGLNWAPYELSDDFPSGEGPLMLELPVRLILEQE